MIDGGGRENLAAARMGNVAFDLRVFEQLSGRIA